ncbi:hypothetical protein BDV93DRAFT_12834 [Ceratobasidium sp. AG-I]|nr:hypothetical protein BDV93DRAFT_12834 [Ceratobasidium sp. AG-I]
MSHPELSSFNPFAPHPFTSGGVSPGASPIQTSTPLEFHAPMPTSGIQSGSGSPAVSPLNAPLPPTHASQQAPSFASPRVFEQYDRGRVTPDLVIRKSLNNWGAQRSFR